MAYDPGLVERVRSILGQRGEFAERKMFGCLAFLINGNMCCGVTKTDLFLRLSVEEASAALRRKHTRPMGIAGKEMKSMVVVDPQGTDSDESLHEWIDTAYAYARTRPAKKPAAKVRRTRRVAKPM